MESFGKKLTSAERHKLDLLIGECDSLRRAAHDLLRLGIDGKTHQRHRALTVDQRLSQELGNMAGMTREMVADSRLISLKYFRGGIEFGKAWMKRTGGSA